MRYTLEEIIQQMGQAREVLEESETKELYLSCLTEMADEVISDLLIEAWSAPDLLKKWSGTPWHYKRLKKALEAAALDVLPEGSIVQINAYSEIWTTATVVAFCPVPGDTTEYDTRLLNTYAPRPLMRRVDGVNTFQLVEDEKHAPRELPPFNELLDACCDVAEVKRERDAAIMAATEKAREIRGECSLGLYALNAILDSISHRLQQCESPVQPPSAPAPPLA